MFEKFLNSPECMRVLTWLLLHSDGEYSAPIIAVQCNIDGMTEFMAVLSTLEGVGLITYDDTVDDLMIRLNKDESITQLLLHLKEEFNDKAFRGEQVAPSLAYLYSPTLKKTIDEKLMNEEAASKILELCENYESLDLSDPVNEEIYNLCLKLKETGEYDDFISRLKE